VLNKICLSHSTVPLATEFAASLLFSRFTPFGPLGPDRKGVAIGGPSVTPISEVTAHYPWSYTRCSFPFSHPTSSSTRGCPGLRFSLFLALLFLDSSPFGRGS